MWFHGGVAGTGGGYIRDDGDACESGRAVMGACEVVWLLLSLDLEEGRDRHEALSDGAGNGAVYYSISVL